MSFLQFFAVDALGECRDERTHWSFDLIFYKMSHVAKSFVVIPGIFGHETFLQILPKVLPAVMFLGIKAPYAPRKLFNQTLFPEAQSQFCQWNTSFFSVPFILLLVNSAKELSLVFSFLVVLILLILAVTILNCLIQQLLAKQLRWSLRHHHFARDSC